MLTRVFTSAVALTATSAALAHPGHDHSHWSSPAVHALFFIGIAVVLGAAAWQIRKQIKAKRDQGES
ncbi:hypothetical protein [Marinomonas ostreistagni]|uniref:hypothetical protein n=1 Tax=Marinomonas ostreistagni TaxID=359209 RepID=UPI00194F656D|nr:hypothetical protein [Marinomonas ostreistagni]MBM6550725.1 hypothetical protein [Marinomonas ostreistagni]